MSAAHIYWQRANRKLLIVAAVAAAILCQSAYNNYTVLANKAGQQNAALAQLKRWKSEYEVLRPIQTDWNTVLPPVKDLTDIDHVYAAIRLDKIGLRTNQERLVIKKIEPISSNGIALNAVRICINTSGETGLAVTASHFSPELLNGIEALANRRDIVITNIALSAVNETPKAVLDLCLVFRY